MLELKVKIGKMNCTNCSNSIERICKKIEGVKDVSVSYINSSGIFLIENSQTGKEVLKKIKDLGFEVLDGEESLTQHRKKELISIRSNLLLSLILSAVIMYFEMFDSSLMSLNIQVILSFFVLFYCGRSFFIHTFLGIKYKNLDMNTLVSLGSLSAFVYSILAYFKIFDSNEYFYFSSGTMIITFVLLGKFLEANAKFKAEQYQKKLNNIDTKKAKILNNNGEIEEISSAFVKAGDTLILNEGESVVADGIVLHGSADLDISFLNGEFLPLRVSKGSPISSGSIVLNGSLHIKAEKKAMDSTLEQIKDLVFQAGSIKTPLTSLADKISKYFVGSLLLFALAVFLFWLFKENSTVAFLHSCAVLLISCPCALGLATPLALVSATTTAAKHFVLIKNPSALENLSSIKKVLFDKTGTLTQNTLQIFTHNLNKEYFEKLARIESTSSHPIAKAIFKASNLEKNTVSGNINIIAGNGIEYKENGDVFLIGNEDFLKNTYNFENAKAFLNSVKDQAPLEVYFAKNGVCLGAVALSNTLKEGAKELIDTLKKQKITSIIVSGDNKKSVEKTALELGIVEFYGDLKPADKLDFIKKMKEKVLFVGDGINDAAALALANVSISFAKASDLAKQNGDFLLIKDTLSTISWCFKLSHKTQRVIKLNLFWAFLYNSLCIPIAAGFIPFITLSPHIAALAMCLSSVTVVLNSLRLKRI
ncbi:cation-translocating P-type ATPase [Campylobacter sp. MIT 21-1685]|uniref:heavy metal translocating P-type ATPase n=1 Tax=unclassified Campylobacter TaxID=2593542 RepID=UPI00224AA275|nr:MULTISPECIES: cation-translocating P-type ATPase [unclassified Campylobacter]MCX2683680.1 cation-translocating P-type ATPase [Campylobacter sp. MIT 21-1684]MCX2751965.1 cation-translocating P-type ATPase [Campylobacter sp. MIT 21-1682]MCX2808173.1 cation-translocating P-type ATPase [Campylobacter sp. MIT 21-1685]